MEGSIAFLCLPMAPSRARQMESADVIIESNIYVFHLKINPGRNREA